MVKVSWRGMGMAVASILAMSVAADQAQAGSGTPLFRMFTNSQDDAAPAVGNWQSTARSGKALTTTHLVTDGSQEAFMTAGSLQALQAAEAHYQQIASQGGWGTLGSGSYRAGSRSKGIAALNHRLMIEGYLSADQGDTYTPATQQAVSLFQHNHGLAMTGAIDGATLRELNIPVQARIATIRANEPRFAHNANALGNRYVVVNVPAQQVEAVENGRVYSVHNVIVGRPLRPTPVVVTALQTIRFNPYWNVPVSIAQRDLIPRMISEGAKSVMAQMNMKIFKGYNGPEVDPGSVNWRTANPSDYYFRQEPGGANAMATAKIEFNSPFGIYLHDTPEPELFNSGQRFYSSGCVRVQNVALLINWILNGQDGINPARIAELAKTKERLDVTIQNPPQIRVAYLTAWPSLDGTVAFRPDIYQMDGSGFVVGQPNPVGQGGERFTLKPVPWQAEALASEGGGDFFANLFGSHKSSAAPAVAAKVKPAATQVATQAVPAKTKKPFNLFESFGAKSKTAETTKKKPVMAEAAKSAKGKKPVLAAAKPSATKATAAKATANCKPGKDGKPAAECKSAADAAKPKPKLPATTASAN